MTDTNDCPIAAQFRLCAGTPVVYLFDKEGRYKGEGDSDYDLFLIAPEPELSEFEERVRQLIGSYPCATKENKGLLIYEVRKAASELLELAKKELQEEVIHDYWKQAADRCAQAKEEGKAEALKDLPRWKKCDPNTIYKADFNFVSNGVERHIILNGYMINLDRLKKLPGFNE